MRTIKLTTAWPEWHWLRQTPQFSGEWANWRFVVNEDVDECDFWVVYGDLRRPERCRCARERTLFIFGEPPTIDRLNTAHIAQFATIWTVDRTVRHRNPVFADPALPWHLGINGKTANGERGSLGFEDLMALASVPKTKALSVISSDKTFTPWHAKRLEFVNRLAAHFGDRIDVFGRGVRDIADKSEAILPYRYHIVLENCAIPDYWTEKLPDAYLGGAFPIYWGAPNIGKYFPDGSYVAIDIERPDDAIGTIEAVLADDPYEDRLDVLRDARRRVLYDYNLFARLANYANRFSDDAPKSRMTLWPTSMCGRRRLFTRLRHRWPSIDHHSPIDSAPS